MIEEKKPRWLTEDRRAEVIKDGFDACFIRDDYEEALETAERFCELYPESALKEEIAEKCINIGKHQLEKNVELRNRFFQIAISIDSENRAKIPGLILDKSSDELKKRGIFGKIKSFWKHKEKKNNLNKEIRDLLKEAENRNISLEAAQLKSTDFLSEDDDVKKDFIKILKTLLEESDNEYGNKK